MSISSVSGLINGLTRPSSSSPTGKRASIASGAMELDERESSGSPEGQEQEPDHEQEDGDEKPAKRQKRSRACQACRSMKIRCLPVEGQEACKACSKVNRTCVMPGPARKRQKTVHKVAELEKKIDALTKSLAAKNNTATAPTPPHDSPATTTTPSSRMQPPQTRPDREYSYDKVLETHYPSLSTDPKPHPPDFDRESGTDEYEDVITRGVIDETIANKIYGYWKTKMCPLSPLVAFPDRVTVAWLRQKRPMTLLAIFVAAGSVFVPDTQPDLAVEMARQLSERVMFVNEKSLDLVQSMLVYSIWYGKHKYAKDLGFNHYIHSAVAMCLDLGLGKRSRQQTYSDPEDADLRRTWMGCYIMAGNVSTVLRLPPLVKYSPYIEECLDSFATHPGALPTDAFLCRLVRLTHLLQDVGLLFHMDDPGSTILLNDSRTQYHLKLFEHQLEDWKAGTKQHLQESVLNQYEAVVSLYIHEIALHNEHNVDDFRPMYRSTGRETPAFAKDFLTNAHFESLTACVDAMQRAMQAFLDMDPETVGCVPSLHIVWTAYVAVAMIRLYGVLAVPGSKYGNIFLPQLNVNSYLDACVNKLNLATSIRVHAPTESFTIAFKKLKAWHMHRTMQLQRAIGNANSDQANSGGDATERASEAYLKAYNEGGNLPNCPSTTGMDSTISPRSLDDNSQHTSPHTQQQSLQSQFQRQPNPYPRIGQPYVSEQPPQQLPTPLGTNSSLLDPNTAIDASTFDIQNWDFSVGELNNFENYLNDAGWMGYLM